MIGRRTLAAMFGACLLIASQASAEEPVHRVGVIAQSEIPEQAEGWPRGLREHGWIEDRNIQVDYRYYSDQPERIPVLAAELAALKPEVIVAAGPLPARAVQTAAPEIPLVFLGIGDPIGLGFIHSLAHPGKNATGIAGVVHEGFSGKQIQLLKELVPQASQIAVLTDPTNPIHQREKAELPDIERELRVKLLIVEADGIDQAATALDAASKQGAQAIQIWGDPYLLVRSPEIVALAARYRLPAGYFFRQNVLDGGLISLGPDFVDPWHRAADYVDRILKGARPADLPVWQPTQYHLAVNLKTAAALGITVPPLVLAEADEVIDNPATAH